VSRSAATLRSVALPVEHGGWGLALEPIVLGLLVAPSGAGGLLGLFGAMMFLAHRPTRLVLVDVRRKRRAERTLAAAVVAAAYLAAAGAALAGAFAVAEHDFWWPLAASLPLVAVQAWYETRSRTRQLGRELAGPLAAASIAPAIASAGGWSAADALGLWAVLAVRIVGSVILVRAQIHRAHGRPYQIGPVVGVHVAGGALGVAGAALGLIPWLAAGALVGLGLWAAVALRLPAVRAVVVGITQMAVGAAVVLATAAGHRAGW
jgi:hypothetical protein